MFLQYFLFFIKIFMITLFILIILLLLSSQTYLSYIFFLLATVLLVLYILILGHYYIGLIYLMIYVGSIAVLFIYILMVLSIISSYRYGYLLFILSFFIIFSVFGTISLTSEMLYNTLSVSIELYSILLLPIALILFIAMIFAIRSI